MKNEINLLALSIVQVALFLLCLFVASWLGAIFVRIALNAIAQRRKLKNVEYVDELLQRSNRGDVR